MCYTSGIADVFCEQAKQRRKQTRQNWRETYSDCGSIGDRQRRTLTYSIESIFFERRSSPAGVNLSSQLWGRRNSKMEALASLFEAHSSVWATKRRRTCWRTSYLNDTKIPLQPCRGRCGRKKVLPIFSNFELFFRVCSRAILASKMRNQLLRGGESTCRYVEQSRYQQTKNDLCPKNASDGESQDISPQTLCRVADLDWFSLRLGSDQSAWNMFAKMKRWGPRKLIELVGDKNLMKTSSEQEKNLPTYTK